MASRWTLFTAQYDPYDCNSIKVSVIENENENENEFERHVIEPLCYVYRFIRKI